MKALGIALGACVLTVAPAWADNHEESEGREFVPVETFTCNYVDGKGPEDLDEATAFWNKWADKNGLDNYYAITVTPIYHGAETFDVGWLGVWPSGEGMGMSGDLWMAKGSEAAAKFAEVVDCATHSNFATTRMKAPPDTDPDNFYLAFSDCDVRDAAAWDQVMEGMGKWSAYQAENGYENGTWMMFAAYGGGDEEFDFKLVESWDTMTDLGEAYDMYGTGGDWAVRGEMMGDSLSCDASRLYMATVRRRAAEE